MLVAPSFSVASKQASAQRAGAAPHPDRFGYSTRHHACGLYAQSSQREKGAAEQRSSTPQTAASSAPGAVIDHRPPGLRPRATDQILTSPRPDEPSPGSR